MVVPPERDPAVVELLLKAMEKTSQNALIVFQKNALSGKVKTRLAATLGNAKALKIYRYLVEKTFFQINNCQTDMDVRVYFSDFVEEIRNENSRKNIISLVQEGNDLGERMKMAFRKSFAEGYNKIVIVGTDCPELTPDLIEDAFHSLDETTVVFGPAKDGGYYLLGMNIPIDRLFEDIPWSTSNVLKISTLRLDELNITYRFLTILSDIDTEEDWLQYKKLIPHENE